jgi:hypothetical protein
MTQKQIAAICKDIGCGEDELERLAMSRTKEYLERNFTKEGKIDPAYLTTVAGSYFDGVLDTLKTIRSNAQ